MKFTTVALAAAASANAAVFERLHLPDPQNWVAGPRLFPSHVLAGYNADYHSYEENSWAMYVLQQCEEKENCTSTNSFSAINSGQPKVRTWFGYVFGGDETTEADYTRVVGVQDSVVYVRR